MDFIIKQGQELPIEIFQEILDLDKSTYGDQVITNEGLAFRRYEKFKDGIIAAFFNHELAGFFCFYSVNANVYDQAVNRQLIFDDNLQVADLKPLTPNKPNYVLLLDMNIKKQFRSEGLARRLEQTAGNYLIQKENEGYKIDKIFAYAYTEEGFKILKNLGGHVVWEKEGMTLMDLLPAAFMELSQ
ncbi:hypothetical protein Q5O14_00720 [Eubacteriaceae bacterium ES2]|nr:hypothetical protein Q5O14_00720 [Eubacteriaceae bacterium ES2]